jgi:hypothetical protein
MDIPDMFGVSNMGLLAYPIVRYTESFDDDLLRFADTSLPIRSANNYTNYLDKDRGILESNNSSFLLLLGYLFITL